MVKNFSDFLNKTFIDEKNWHQQFINIEETTQNILLDESNLKKYLENNLLELSKLISKSILRGEYIIVDIETPLKESLNICSTILNDILLIENTKLHEYVENFIAIIKRICSIYLNFFKQVKTYLSNPNTDIVFSTSKEYSSEYDLNIFKNFENEISNKFKEIQKLLVLSAHDHYFDESISYFRSLINFENQINQINIKEPISFIGAINHKITFLKYKWTIRQITTANELKDYNLNKTYIIDNDLISINQNSSYNPENDKLKEWKEFLENHYDYVRQNSHYSNKINDLLIKEKVSFQEFHLLIKYFKDIKPNYENLKEIVDKFHKREDEFKKDNHIFLKNILYALNNQFSLLIEEPSVNEQDVVDLKKRIDSLQDKTGFDNFFVDFKFLKFNIKKLDELITSRDALEVKSEINTKIHLIRSLIISCERKMKWSENHHNLLYQLPYDESLVKYNNEDFDEVYYASSFLLPLSIEQKEKQFLDLKLEFQEKYNHYEILGALNKEFAIIKELKNNTENSDKKSVETLTIFTAIISFIVGTISGFSFIDSFIKAIIFILIFSFSLMSFVMLIFISTRGIEKIKNYKKIIISTYIGFLIVLSLLFLYKNFVDDKNELEKIKTSKIIDNKKYIDSIYKIQQINIKKIEDENKKNIDSIKKVFDLKIESFKIELNYENNKTTLNKQSGSN
ncbi:hypothetical protein [Flavobacterium covae]|uniref:hypothetical protein n=1 Tax=Flavobacterium covae TaxID=2906076 RepID=UPI000745CD0A|nr:hypothetical protein [Flavobacterium covae]AMA49984.1 hypothetical protein AWN65_11205 [Flavobacterium covae]MCJ1808604.1 hypothetical protein [Flavobacterium covae]